MTNGEAKKPDGGTGTVTRHSQRPSTGEITQRMQALAKDAVRFGRDFTEGISRREIERLFDEDAKGALTALSGRRSDDYGDKGGLTRFVQLAGGFFKGLTLQLSPGRRLLFAASLFFPILGLLDFHASFGRYISVDFSPFWFLCSTAGLTLLLALELVDRLRVRDELEVARQLQQELLPKRLPELPGYRVAHSYRTANEIGGDYYDFIELDDGRVAIAVGDASGHGISAGLLMAIANSALKLAIDLDPSPTAVLELLNKILCRTGSGREFMSLFYGLIDPASGEFEYANSGHPFPLLRRASGEVVELGVGSLPLGIRRDVQFTAQHQTVGRGDFLVLYSDGLPEAIGGEGEESFGFDRIKGLLAHPHSPQQVHDRILAAFDRHLGDRPVSDDLTLVVIDRAPYLPDVVGPSP